MASAGELKAQRVNTLAFIKANPVEVTLIPCRKMTDGGGTRYVDDPPRPAQTFRLVDQSTARERSAGVIRTSDGQDRIAEFMLLGTYDAKIGLYDHWTGSDGKTYELGFIYPSNGYEVRASVVAR